MILHQRTHLFPHLFETTPRASDFKLAASLTTSVKLDDAQGLRKVENACFTGAYSQDDLSALFASLQSYVSPDMTQPISLILSSSSQHSITIGYHPQKQCWYFIDANHLPSQTVYDTHTLAEKIMSAFDQTETAVIGVESYATVTNQAAQTCLDNWTSTEAFKHAQQENKHLDERLFLAVKSGEVKQVTSLLIQGASVNYKNSKNFTPLFLAAQNGDLDMIETLFLPRKKDDAKTPIVNADERIGDDGVTPLMVAAKLGHLKVVQFLLANSPVNSLQDKSGATALSEAIANGRTEVADFLLTSGCFNKANIDQGKALQTPLFMAAMQRYNNLIDPMLKLGANPNLACTEDQITPLMIAATTGNIELVQRLLDYGAICNQQDINGETALHYAAFQGHTEIVALLIKQSPQLSLIENSNHQTPLQLAQEYNQQAVVKLISQLTVADVSVEDARKFLTLDNKRNLELEQESADTLKKKPTPNRE